MYHNKNLAGYTDRLKGATPHDVPIDTATALRAFNATEQAATPDRPVEHVITEHDHILPPNSRNDLQRPFTQSSTTSAATSALIATHTRRLANINQPLRRRDNTTATPPGQWQSATTVTREVTVATPTAQPSPARQQLSLTGTCKVAESLAGQAKHCMIHPMNDTDVIRYSTRAAQDHLAAAGWTIARDTLTQMSDRLFGPKIRPHPNAKRRWTKTQLDYIKSLLTLRDEHRMSIAEMTELIVAPNDIYTRRRESRIQAAEAANAAIDYLRVAKPEPTP